MANRLYTITTPDKGDFLFCAPNWRLAWAMYLESGREGRHTVLKYYWQVEVAGRKMTVDEDKFYSLDTFTNLKGPVQARSWIEAHSLLENPLSIVQADLLEKQLAWISPPTSRFDLPADPRDLRIQELEAEVATIRLRLAHHEEEYV